MSVPVTGLPARLALSALAGAGRFCVLGSGVARWRGVRAGHRRGLSDLHLQLVPSQGFRDSPSWLPKYRSEPKSYVTSPKLATTLVQILKKEGKNPDQLFLECNPVPAQKETLFRHLGIEAVPWSEDTPLRVVGIFPAKNEKKILWKLLYDLYSSTSVYSYGRVELNMFITEREYKKLVASPQNPHLYQALSVLWQVACKIKLLHVEPWSSFGVYGQSGRQEKLKNKKPLEQINKQVGQNMCLIQLTPLPNLFTENLTSVNYDVFFHMLKQCFMKRNFKLMDHLQLLSPVNATAILKQIEKNGDMKITDLHPQDFKQLFETIECSKESCRWLFDDCMEEMIM
ncbi:dimethyladenosine transferase 2, mitochondrial isoform X3 [Mirounga angustirostris]|uniref:dimethyladenosine transferase 2, mitochondrial isoform X3 n=1 Tax=Mirounga angustirostris TaxID=9716 RepID=UPI00313EE955